MSSIANFNMLENDFFPKEAVESWLDRKFPERNIQKVLLINPPDGIKEVFQFNKAKRRRYTNYPPYGLGVLAKELLEKGLQVEILNLNHELLKNCQSVTIEGDFDFNKVWQDALAQRIKEFKPDLIGVTCMFTMTHQSLKRVCAEISSFEIPLIVGGVHISNDLERVLDDLPTVDAAFVREGDLALKVFIDVVNKQQSAQELAQVLLVDGGSRLRLLAEMRPEQDDIDVIPCADLMDVGNLSKYGVIGNFHGFRDKSVRFTTVLSNRGCRAQCTFCSVRNFNGKKVRQRSVKSVLDELEQLKNDYGIGHVVWLDDDLLKDERRAVSLFKGMVDRKLKMTWDATNGVIAKSCTDEVVGAMAESGCIALNIGMESGNPEILRQVKKPGTTTTFLNAAEVFKRFPSIHTRVFIMIGFPGETLAQINDTINVCRQMDLDWFSISPLQPLPNTPIYDEMVEAGLIAGVGSTETRFMAGAFGKQDDIESGLRMASKDFKDAFCSIPMDSVPTRAQIDDIWFYMNYHLNFHRLFSETRTQKMEQQLKHLKALSDTISPDHGFALYFQAYLQDKLYNEIKPEIIERLENKLIESDYWRERMEAFGLSVEDLKNRNFKNKEIPRILPGELPKEDLDYSQVVENLA